MIICSPQPMRIMGMIGFYNKIMPLHMFQDPARNGSLRMFPQFWPGHQIQQTSALLKICGESWRIGLRRKMRKHSIILKQISWKSGPISIPNCQVALLQVFPTDFAGAGIIRGSKFQETFHKFIHPLICTFANKFKLFNWFLNSDLIFKLWLCG